MNWMTWGQHLAALVVWREARGEGIKGMAAVAHCMKNRVDNPKWWGTTLAEVVCKKWQFSSMTDPKDHQLATWPTAADKEFAQALLVVDGVIWKKLPAQFPGADSYYDISIPEPAWAWKSIFLGQEGRLRFYNTDGDHPDNS